MGFAILLPENSRRRIRTSLFVLAAIAASVCVFALATYLIGEHWDRFLKVDRAPTLEEVSAVIPIEYALTSKENNDVIVLGDSGPQCGFDPVYFEGLTGLKAYNLASFGPLSIDGFFVTARAYLLNHPAPRIIMLSLCPVTPSTSFANRPFAEQFVRVYGRGTGLVAHESCVEPIKRGAGIIRDDANALLRSYSFRDVQVDGLPGETFNTLAEKRRRQRGYNRRPDRLGQVMGREFGNGTLPVEVEWDRGVRALGRLAEAKGVRLMVRLAPIRADAASMNFDEIRAWLRTIGKSRPNVVVSSEVILYDPKFCSDPRHLNAIGAKKFTKLVADDVLAALERKRPLDQKTSSRDSSGTSETLAIP
jgi:hypothetical protein